MTLMENRGEIILYQPDDEVRLEVRLEEDTVWLNRRSCQSCSAVKSRR